MTTRLDLNKELQDAIAHGSSERRANMLLAVTDLFIRDSNQYSDDEIGLFDDVIIQLAREIETSVRILLAQRLAPDPKAPLRISRMLALDDEIEVAAPILTQSERLDEGTILQIVRGKSQKHLLAISARKSLSPGITDALIERGDRQVLLSAATNLGAKFSDAGYSLLVRRSNGDDALATCVGARPDIPRPLFLILLSTASEMVRAKLMAQNPHSSREIDEAVTAVVKDMQDNAQAQSADEPQAAASPSSTPHKIKRDDDHIQALIAGGNDKELIALLAGLCNLAPDVVEDAMNENRAEAVLVLAKAANLSWTTTKALLLRRSRPGCRAAMQLEQMMASFERLNVKTAQQITDFYRTRRPGTAPHRSPPQDGAQKARSVTAMEHFPAPRSTRSGQ